MKTLGLLIVIVFSSPLAHAQAPVVIDFDDLTAPCDLGSAFPLQDEYLALGVEFHTWQGDGTAVLHECSGLGISGFSPPNFAVIDPDGVLANGGTPNELAFGFTGSAPYRVRARVGGPPGTTLYLGCSICPWAIPGCTIIEDVILGNAMHTVEVSSPSSFQMGCAVYTNDPVGPWIIDDIELDFQQPATPVPELSAVGIAIIVAMIATLGFVAIKRTSGAF